MHEAELRRRRPDAIAAEIRLWTERAEPRRRGLRAISASASSARRTSAQRLLEAPDTYLAAPPRPDGRGRGGRGRSASDAADRLAEAETAARRDRPRRPRRARGALRRARGARRLAGAPRGRRRSASPRSPAPSPRTWRRRRPASSSSPASRPAPTLPAARRDRIASSRGLQERPRAARRRQPARRGGADASSRPSATAIVAERDDLVEAIKRLRQAIGSLNREGRERLLAAFDVVNGHFQRLFTTLFGGGTAELTAGRFGRPAGGRPRDPRPPAGQEAADA